MSTYNIYLKNFNTAWVNEQNNKAPLDTLKAMYKLYLFKQLATDSAIKKTDVNKYFIREVFNIKGDIKKSPFKSCIYNKLTCLHYLIEKTNFSISNKIDVDKLIDEKTDAIFKKYNNFYDIMKLANKKASKPKKEKTESNEQAPKEEAQKIPHQESSDSVGFESNKVVNITNNNPESIVDSFDLLDDLMNTTINHFEVCYKDDPKTALNKLVAFSESINQLINKTSYTIKKVA